MKDVLKYIAALIGTATIFMVADLQTYSSSALADEFYKGKTVRFIIGYGVGGSYNRYSRMIANHIGNFLPGRPSVVPQNKPGAGSVIATNYLYNIAPKDGTEIGMIGQGIQAYQLMGRKNVKADTSKFNWIGRLISNSAVLFSWHTSPIDTIQDALETPFTVSASGSASRLRWLILNRVVGTKIEIITGYKGSAEALLAMQREEVEGVSRPWTAVKAEQGQWIKEGKIVLLLQAGLNKYPDLPDLPRMIDLAKNEQDRELLEFFSRPAEIGRSVVAPPGLPKERVAELRKAFWDAIHSDAFKAELKKTGYSLDPMRGEDLQKLVEASREVDPEILERARQLSALGGKKKK